MGNFAVSCGGTGGHVFPGVATARTLQSRGHTVTLWLAGKAIETAARHAWDGPVVNISVDHLSVAPLQLFRTLTTLLRGYRESVRALRKQRPQALLAMGSYSSVGPVLAAHRLRIPVILHEANVIPGRAIDWLSRFAHTVAISFPETRAHLRHRRVVLTGVPLRHELETAAGTAGPGPDRFTVLVMGGSQGAQRVNTPAVEALSRLHRDGIPLRVIHLTGKRDLEQVSAAYRLTGVDHTVHGFLHDMASAYQRASLAISRSGANSCMELALFGVPALLVPFPEAARNHQLANAQAMAAAGAADVMLQKDLTADSLIAYITAKFHDIAGLEAMRAAARRRALVGADGKLADLVELVAAGR